MEYLEQRRERVEERLEEVVDAVEPTELQAQLRHVALSGGKRVRPMVTLLVCEALSGDEETALDYAVGAELVHNASLVVDDVIDDSDLRRGSAAAWREFGYGPAIIASDGLLGEAFELFSTDERAMQAVAESMVNLGEGEASELVDRPADEAEYMQLARRKTGALFRAAAELGAIAADADAYTVEAVGQYAERVGVAFQMRDDVLDATADADQLGKPTGHDATMERPSLVEVTDLTPEEATDRAREESEAALAALDSVDMPDSEAQTYLRDLAEFVVVRER
jgi:geranylgeranyl diphosphate synthase type I